MFIPQVLHRAPCGSFPVVALYNWHSYGRLQFLSSNWQTSWCCISGFFLSYFFHLGKWLFFLRFRQHKIQQMNKKVQVCGWITGENQNFKAKNTMKITFIAYRCSRLKKKKGIKKPKVQRSYVIGQSCRVRLTASISWSSAFPPHILSLSVNYRIQT